MTNLAKMISRTLISSTFLFGMTLGLDSLNSEVNAQLSNFFFLPPGQQLDGDTILDIELPPGSPISFNVFADPSNFTFDPNTTQLKFNWVYDYDPSELSLVNENILGRVSYTSGSQVPINVGTIDFIATNPGLRPHDGVLDFGIILLSLSQFDNQGNQIGSEIQGELFDPPRFNNRGEQGNIFNQVVEVQKTPESTSTLGLLSLGILGVGATIKRQVKRNHSIEKETTKIG